MAQSSKDEVSLRCLLQDSALLREGLASSVLDQAHLLGARGGTGYVYPEVFCDSICILCGPPQSVAQLGLQGNLIVWAARGYT